MKRWLRYDKGRWFFLFSAFLIGIAAPAVVHAEIQTVFSDLGVPGTPSGFNPIITYEGSGSDVVFSTFPAVVPPPEGYSSFRTTTTVQIYAGWGIVYENAQNLSRFNSGEYRFWVRSSTGTVEVQMKNNNGLVMDTSLSLLGWDWSTMHDQWVLMRISMASVDLSSVKNPGLFTATSGDADFFIDDVRFVTSEVSPGYFNVTLNKRSDNSQTSAITWTGATPASSWALADEYIQLTVDPNTTGWGVQIYTDNTNSNPAYTGAISSTTPNGGLVDTSSTSVVLPMAWEAVATTSPTLTAQDPNSCPGNGYGCLWFYMQDHAVFNQGNPFVFNGAAFITVKNNTGIHYAQGVTFGDPAEFGAANPPNDIYLEANFGTSMGSTAYQTTKLIVEYYTP